jgi:hypothetical protein
MQNYANHRKFIPLFHFVATPILLANFLYAATQLTVAMDTARIMAVLTAFALIIIAFAGRIAALKVQDRVFRLEMRLKLKEVLPADMQGKIALLSAKQMVGLRYASDAELPSLVSQVLKDNITNADAIKKMVKNWQADDLRA